MSAPPQGFVRVLPRVGLPGMVALRWADVRTTHPQLQDWIDSGLVTTTGLRGEPPPDELPRRCCGR